MLNHERGAIPLYLQVFTIIKESIEKEEYSYGDLIPSELELEKQYHVSRITIRQAIAELEKSGYVKRARGKGTSVTYIKRIDESLGVIRSFTKEMSDRGFKAGTSYVDIKEAIASEEVASALEIEEGSKVYHLYRVRTADKEPIVIFETYLSGAFDFPLDVKRYQGSMYDVFEHLGIHQPTKVRENFQAVQADEEIAKRLEVEVGSPIFLRKRIAYTNENIPVEYTISYYRGDRYSYSIELKN